MPAIVAMLTQATARVDLWFGFYRLKRFHQHVALHCCAAYDAAKGAAVGAQDAGGAAWQATKDTAASGAVRTAQFRPPPPPPPPHPPGGAGPPAVFSPPPPPPFTTMPMNMQVVSMIAGRPPRPLVVFGRPNAEWPTSCYPFSELNSE